MSDFLRLELEDGYPAPRIGDILSKIQTSPNAAFFTAANRIRYLQKPNPIYTFVAIRDLIQLSPIGSEAAVTKSEYSPEKSFKWLYLLAAMTTAKIQADESLIKARNKYIFSKLRNCLMTIDMKIPEVMGFAVGILCLASRLVSELEYIPDEFLESDFISFLVNLIKDTPSGSLEIKDQDFGDIGLGEYLYPSAMQKSPFSDIQSLLRKSCLRLVLRIGSKVSDNSQMKSVLLELSTDPNYSGLAIFALASILCGNIDEAHKYVDKEMYEANATKLLSFSGVPTQYSGWVELSLTLSKMASTAIERPVPWKEYATTNKKLMEFLLTILLSDGDESILAKCAQLIRLGPEPLPDTRDLLKLMANTRPGSLHSELGIMMKANVSSLMDIVHEVLPLASKRGSNSKHLLAFLAEAIPGNLLESAVSDALKSTLTSIKGHPDFSFYSDIAKYVKLNTAVFPREPCPTCCSSQPVYQSYQVKISRQTAKFTHDSITVKLPNAVQFSELTVIVSPRKYRKLPRKATITFSGENVQNINSIDTLNFSEPVTFEFSKELSKDTVKLTIPVYASALRVTFSDFIYDNNQPLNCLSCRNKVSDTRSGVCSNCRENVYACRECRHINYNFLDGFICRECGYSYDAVYEVSGMASPAFEFTRISNPNDRAQSLTALDTLSGEGSHIFTTLENMKESIAQTLRESEGVPLGETSGTIDKIYARQAKASYATFIQKIAHLSEIRKALNTSPFPRETKLGCFECNLRFAKSCISTLNDSSLSLLMDLERDPIFGRSARRRIVKIAKLHPEISRTLIENNASTLTLVDVVNIEDIHQGMRSSIIVSLGNSSVLNAVTKSQYLTKYDLFRAYLSWRHIPLPSFWNSIPYETKLSLILNPSKGIRESALTFLHAISKENIIGAVSLVNKTLSRITEIDNTFSELIQFANNLSGNQRAKSFMIHSGTLDAALSLLYKESTNDAEDLSAGKVLNDLANLVKSIFQEDFIQEFTTETPSRVSILSKSLFNIVARKGIKTRFIQYSIEILQTLVSLIAGSGSEGKSIIFEVGIESVPLGPPVVKTLLEVLFPREKPSDTLILMKKCRIQEDFIPGQLTREPVPSAEIGLLMRDIKNRVCTELGMDSMLEDDRGVELLVDNNIVALDLKISDVASHLWNPNHAGEAMEVIFRVQGLSGEATENMVTSFARAREEIDITQTLGFAKTVCENGGLKVLLDAMPTEPSDVSLLLTELSHYLGTLSPDDISQTVVRQILTDFDGDDEDHIVRLLDLVKGYIREGEGETILTLLGRAEEMGKERVIAPLLALLPSLSSSPTLRSRTLLFFLSGGEDVLSESHLANSFGDFMMLLPAGSSGDSVRSEVMSKGIFKDAADRLTQGLVTPSVLKTLAGTGLGYEPAQKVMLEGNHLELLMKVEKEVSEDSRGELALRTLENLSRSPSICTEAIERMRSSLLNTKKERAQKGKMQALENFVIPEGLLGFLEEEDTGFECCVCKEGTLDGLNFYAYINQGKQGAIVSTHFTCIHQKCHSKATTTEKRRLAEWEAAKVRNCERVCNTLFPVPEGREKREQYISRLFSVYSKYVTNDRLAHSILNNISTFVNLLSKSEAYAFQLGGGSLSNQAAAVPYLVYSLSLLLESRRSNRQSISQTLQGSIDNGTDLEIAPAIALVLSTGAEWQEMKSKLIGMALKKLPGEEGINLLKQYVIYDKMQKMMKPSGEGIEGFLETVEGSGKEVIGKWQVFGDEISHELNAQTDVRQLLIKVDVSIE